MSDPSAATTPAAEPRRIRWKVAAAAVVVALTMYAVAFTGVYYAPRTRRGVVDVPGGWQTLVAIYAMSAVLIPWTISLFVIRAHKPRLTFLIALFVATVVIQVCGGNYFLQRLYYVRP